ncbi:MULTISPECIES: transposase [Chryseobacterium]|jgi:hypothetical protein|uniref:transposase n=1 Tax=Chryseobacterium TaxID=59732 RepID=UPI001AE937C3|nr:MULTISPECIES: transposase [Chryseobacterium]MBP1164664.1 hypothetical protein [Chryseobacterium sp. PvR013]MDR6461529.1 hypothetical protein [Chryseobacterium sediminis]
MSSNIFKNIHIGDLLKKRVVELAISESRICSFLSLSPVEVSSMYKEESIDSKYLLLWSKLLEYDFFRIYSQHLILYAPASTIAQNNSSHKSTMPKFRKNIYTKEVIDFMIELVTSKQKTINEVTLEYGIPKTTLHKWVTKYTAGVG